PSQRLISPVRVAGSSSTMRRFMASSRCAGPGAGRHLTIVRRCAVGDPGGRSARSKAHLPGDPLTLTYSERNAVARAQELGQRPPIPTVPGEAELVRAPAQVRFEQAPLSLIQRRRTSGPLSLAQGAQPTL